MIVENLPPDLTLILTEVSLLIIGIVAEKHYVSRLTSFTNAVALTIHLLSQSETGFWIGIYVDLSILLGVIGLYAYIQEQRLPEGYYLISFFLFSSVNVALVIGLSSFSFFVPLGIGIIVQLILARVGGEGLVHFGDFSGAVKRFHQQNDLTITDQYGHRKYDFSDWFQ